MQGTSRGIERTNSQAKHQLDIQARMRAENLYARILLKQFPPSLIEKAISNYSARFNLLKKAQQLYKSQQTEKCLDKQYAEKDNKETEEKNKSLTKEEIKKLYSELCSLVLLYEGLIGPKQCPTYIIEVCTQVRQETENEIAQENEGENEREGEVEKEESK